MFLRVVNGQLVNDSQVQWQPTLGAHDPNPPLPIGADLAPALGDGVPVPRYPPVGIIGTEFTPKALSVTPPVLATFLSDDGPVRAPPRFMQRLRESTNLQAAALVVALADPQTFRYQPPAPPKPPEGWQARPITPISTSALDAPPAIPAPPKTQRPPDDVQARAALAAPQDDLPPARQLAARRQTDAWTLPPLVTAVVLAPWFAELAARAAVAAGPRAPQDATLAPLLAPISLDPPPAPRRTLPLRLLDGWQGTPITPIAPWFQESPPRSSQPKGRPEFETWGLAPLPQLARGTFDDTQARRAPAPALRPPVDPILPSLLRGIADLPLPLPARALGPRPPEGWWSPPLTALAPWFQETPPRSSQPKGRPEFEPWGLVALNPLSTAQDVPLLARAPFLARRPQDEPALPTAAAARLALAEDRLQLPARLAALRAPDGFWASPLVALAPWFADQPTKSSQPKGRPEFEPWGLKAFVPAASPSFPTDYIPRPAPATRGRRYDELTGAAIVTLKPWFAELLLRAAAVPAPRLPATVDLPPFLRLALDDQAARIPSAPSPRRLLELPADQARALRTWLADLQPPPAAARPRPLLPAADPFVAIARAALPDADLRRPLTGAVRLPQAAEFQPLVIRRALADEASLRARLIRTVAPPSFDLVLRPFVPPLLAPFPIEQLVSRPFVIIHRPPLDLILLPVVPPPPPLPSWGFAMLGQNTGVVAIAKSATDAEQIGSSIARAVPIADGRTNAEALVPSATGAKKIG